MLILMAEDMASEKPYFKPYYDILPKSLNHIPLFWSDADLSLLDGSPLQNSVHIMRSELSKLYGMICEVAPEFAALTTFDKFMWMYGSMVSRNYYIRVGPKGTKALIPFADMLNHMQTLTDQISSKTTWNFDINRQEFVMKAIDDIRMGEEIFQIYGVRTNSDLLFVYGFTMEDFNVSDSKSLIPFDVSSLSFVL